MSTGPGSRVGRGAPTSLQTKVLSVGWAVAFLVLVGGGILFILSLGDRNDLAAATDTFVEEQRVADRIQRAVLRQIASTSLLPTGDVGRTRSELRESSDEVYGQIRRYLFLDLSPAQRLQLEEMAEEHQRLEVAGARTTDLIERGLLAEAEASRDAVALHAFRLLDKMETFLQMRENDLDTLRDRQGATVQALLAGMAVVALLFVLGTLLLVWVLNRRVGRPFQELALASERIAGGDLDVRLPPGADLESRIVTAGFNRMAESLRRTTSELEDRNRELTETLATLHDAQAELVQSEKLSAVGRMTAGLAHELNNPLASVLGYGQLMADHLDGRPTVDAHELKPFIDLLLDEAVRAQHLIRNFLRFSRKSEATLAPVPLRDPLEVATTLRGYSFQQAGLELRVEEVPDVSVRADPEMLQSVVLNLVNNAFDALSPAGKGALTIRGEKAGRSVRLLFEDDGPGLDRPDRVFDPFFTTKSVGEGTGLGLTVVHRLVSLFGGTVRAENRPEGGARFMLTLPVSAPRVEPEGPEVEKAEAADPPGEGMTALDEAGPGGSLGPRILVVEDEAPLRDLQERLLDRLNAEVWTATNVDEARVVLAEKEVDIVLSDVKMPGESGMALYRWVVESRPELAESFLFVTGDVSDPELVALAERRPELFIHKPFDIADNLARVSELMGSSANGRGE